MGIRYEKKYNSYLPCVQVVMTTDVPLRRLVGLFGGSVSLSKSKNKNHRSAFHYTALGKNAKSLINATLPFLMEKHAQALDLLKLQESIDEWNAKGRLRGNIPTSVMELRRSLKDHVQQLKHDPLQARSEGFPRGKREELAYLAGILEAEGCFSIGRGEGNAFYATVSVQMCCRPILQRLMQRFGGTVIAMKVKSGHKPKFMWRVKGSYAGDVARAVSPYLTFKTEEADLVRMLQNTTDLWAKKCGRKGLPSHVVEKRIRLMARIHAIHGRARAETKSEQPIIG